jgi:hypothetical protein
METIVAILGALAIPVILLTFLPAVISLMRGAHRFAALALNIIAFPLLVVPPFAVIAWLIALIFACTGGTRTEVIIVRDTRKDQP